MIHCTYIGGPKDGETEGRDEAPFIITFPTREPVVDLYTPYPDATTVLVGETRYRRTGPVIDNCATYQLMR